MLQTLQELGALREIKLETLRFFRFRGVWGLQYLLAGFNNDQKDTFLLLTSNGFLQFVLLVEKPCKFSSLLLCEHYQLSLYRFQNLARFTEGKVGFPIWASDTLFLQTVLSND
uniref:(northern house mosquito) hypothetical protein n=1 Tax=Culex pipiens TaxID=7175 RepID=A0A8D8ACX3_CULPI